MTEIDYDRIERDRTRIRDTYLRADRPGSSARGVHHVALICADVERTIQNSHVVERADPRSSTPAWC